MLGARAQKSQKKPIARYSARNNALTFSCKSCAVKRPRAPEPSEYSTRSSHLGKGTPLPTPAKAYLPDAECTAIHDTFQSESGCGGLRDSIIAVKQVQYSDAHSWQLLLSQLMSYLLWCRCDRLGMDAMRRNGARYRRTWSPTTLRHYVYWRSMCHFILNMSDCSKGKIKIHLLKKVGFVITKRFSIH